jgi:hypothetical protein
VLFDQLQQRLQLLRGYVGLVALSEGQQRLMPILRNKVTWPARDYNNLFKLSIISIKSLFLLSQPELS